MKEWLADEKDLWSRYVARARDTAGLVPDWMLNIDYGIVRAIASIDEKWSQDYEGLAGRTYAKARAKGAVPRMELAWRVLLVFILVSFAIKLFDGGAQRALITIGWFALSWWCFRWVMRDIRGKKTPPSKSRGSSLPRFGRAFRDQIGKWPIVTRSGNGYVLTATHDSPRYVKRPKTYATCTAIAVFAYCMTKPNGFAGGLMFGVIAAFASYPLWKIYHRVRLKIRVQNGGASWVGPEKARCRIGPDEEYEGIARPHHLAQHAGWAQQQDIRRGVIKPKQNLRQTFEISSEVLFRTGWQKNMNMPVAEILPDISGQKAGALAAALDLALHENRKAVARAKAERMAAAGRSSRNRSDTDDE